MLLCDIGWCGVVARDGVERGSVQEAEHYTKMPPDGRKKRLHHAIDAAVCNRLSCLVQHK